MNTFIKVTITLAFVLLELPGDQLCEKSGWKYDFKWVSILKNSGFWALKSVHWWLDLMCPPTVIDIAVFLNPPLDVSLARLIRRELNNKSLSEVEWLLSILKLFRFKFPDYSRPQFN
ncbi:MAG: hypothetical protein PVI26_13085 [Chitinispirillia bacterium]|jgi:hypothetical protein